MMTATAPDPITATGATTSITSTITTADRQRGWRRAITAIGSAEARRRLSRLAGAVFDRAFGLSPGHWLYRIERDIPVPMPDGVTLLGNLYRPDRAPRRGPVVLIRSPYGRSGPQAIYFAAPLARRGFVVFMQSTRGTFGSGGQFRPFTSERDDGLATLAWLREQPWCDGRVATTGGSYLGHTQWAIAPYADPPLEAAMLGVTASRMSLAFYHGGAPGTLNALNWSSLIGTQERGFAGLPLPNPLTDVKVKRVLRRLPLQAADVAATGAPVAFWRDFTGHATPGDDFWSGKADVPAADLARMPPSSMLSGWWDLFIEGQLDDFAALRAAGVPVKIVVGPWQHGEPGELRAGLHQDIAWLEHRLRDAPEPAAADVRLYLQEGDTWLDFDAWPPADSEDVRLHLAAGGQLVPEHQHAPPDGFTYDPAHPTPSVGGPLLTGPAKQADNAAVEARPDVLTYTGDVHEQDVDLVGHVRARIFVRTSRPYADLFVRLCDVGPDGVSRNIVDGIRRLDPASVPADDVRAGADGVLAVDVRLYPTAYRVRAGHRLRVQVSGGAFPRFARNLGTPEPFATARTPEVTRFEVFHDPAHPSAIVMPVLPPAASQRSARRAAAAGSPPGSPAG